MRLLVVNILDSQVAKSVVLIPGPEIDIAVDINKTKRTILRFFSYFK